MNLRALPTELLIAILAFLDAHDIQAFCRASRFTRAIFMNSAHLRYIVTLAYAGMDDANPPWVLDVGDRLAYLTNRESLWHFLDLIDARRLVIPIVRQHSHVHNLSAGTFILGDQIPDSLRTNSLSYVRLPRCFHVQGLRGELLGGDVWTRLPLGVDAINFGVALEEHDLLAVLAEVPGA